MHFQTPTYIRRHLPECHTRVGCPGGHSTTPMGFAQNFEPRARVASRFSVSFGIDSWHHYPRDLSNKSFSRLPKPGGTQCKCSYTFNSRIQILSLWGALHGGPNSPLHIDCPTCTFKPLFLNNKNFPLIPTPCVACPRRHSTAVLAVIYT